LDQDVLPVAEQLPNGLQRATSDLILVVQAWPGLSEPVRAGIVAMVRASIIAEQSGPQGDDTSPDAG